MPEKRKHIRVVHRDVVRFDAAGTTIEGFSVDISRNGMQVVVSVPQAFDRIESIRFTLPHHDAEVEVPVRLTRRSETPDSRTGFKLGFEFQRGAEEQIRLIEHYIRDSKLRRIEVDGTDEESRRIPRLDCTISGVRTDHPSLHGVSVQNVSPGGLLLRASGSAQIDDSFELVLPIPGDTRRITVVCRVAYVITHPIEDSISLGVRFIDLPEVQQARIRNFVENAAASDSLRSVQTSLDRAVTGAGYVLDSPEEIARILQKAHQKAVSVYLLIGDDLTIRSGSIGPEKSGLSVTVDEPVHPEPGTPVFVSFAVDGSSHYLSTEVLRSPEPLVIAVPDRIHRMDKRSYGRKSVDELSRVTLFLEADAYRCEVLTGHLVDISRRGFLCEVSVPESYSRIPETGMAIGYRVDPKLNLLSHGRIRHIIRTNGTDRGDVLLIGVEAGVHRGNLKESTISSSRWAERVMRTADLAKAPDSVGFGARPDPAQRVRYHNRRGEHICALVNRTGPGTDATVIVIPPAFGKKKETLAPLAAALLTNFSRAGESAVVVRFDGINRPGESHNYAGTPVRGYEMLRYRPTQGVDDIRTTLDYVYNNDQFSPARVVLVTSSMSSVDARKLLLSDNRVSAWVSLMGVPAARSTLANVLAGTDIIANYRMGIRNGVRGMLGHLVDMDVLARDLIDQKYAFLTDSRIDLSQIPVPVLWIVGIHDHWVDESEVLDIMSMESGAERTLIRIPAGHNLRNSDDATEAFRIITGYALAVAGHEREAVPPRKSDVLQMITREREAVFRPLEESEITEYWRSYLLGNRNGSEGYDFYRNLVDFRRFIAEEAALVTPQPGRRIADMGCGTGILTEELLRVAAGAAPADEPCDIEIVAVDLVPEALERTKQKCSAVSRELPALRNARVRFESRNLEPNRLRPLSDFVEHPGIPVEFLRGRIDGLPDRIIDRWADANHAGLLSFLRGETTDPREVRETGRDAFAVELNRASRFIRGTVFAHDLRSPPPGLPDDARIVRPHSYRADDLCFDILKFGSFTVPDPRSPVPEAGSFDAITASLFISYILNVDYLMVDFHRLLKPGGTLLVSSMKPDSDVSAIFTEYVRNGKQLDAARAMLNEAAALFELEEDGYFRFYTADELAALLDAAGFTNIEVRPSLGNPAQAYIVTGTAGAQPVLPWSVHV